MGNDTNTLNFTDYNTHVYYIHSDLDSFIPYNEDDISEQVNKIEIDSDIQKILNHTPNEELNSQDFSSPEQQHNGEYEL